MARGRRTDGCGGGGNNGVHFVGGRLGIGKEFRTCCPSNHNHHHHKNHCSSGNSIGNRKLPKVLAMIFREPFSLLLLYFTHLTPYYEVFALNQNPGYGNLFIVFALLTMNMNTILGVGFGLSRSPTSNTSTSTAGIESEDDIACASVITTVLNEDWSDRMYSAFLSSFAHETVFEIYANVVPLIWFGKPLEKVLGPIRFVVFICGLVLVENLVTCLVNLVLAKLYNDIDHYYWICMSGFYGVVYILWVLNCAWFRDNLTKIYYFESLRTKTNPCYIPFLFLMVEAGIAEFDDDFLYSANWPAVGFALILVLIVRLIGCESRIKRRYEKELKKEALNSLSDNNNTL